MIIYNWWLHERKEREDEKGDETKEGRGGNGKQKVVAIDVHTNFTPVCIVF